MLEKKFSLEIQSLNVLGLIVVIAVHLCRSFLYFQQCLWLIFLFLHVIRSCFKSVSVLPRFHEALSFIDDAFNSNLTFRAVRYNPINPK